MLTKLPPRETQEADEIIKRFYEGDIEALWRELGYADRTSFLTSIKRRYHTDFSKVGLKADGVPSPLDTLEKAVLNIVQKHPISVGEISRQIDRSSETVIKLLDSLRAKHHNVSLDNISRLVDLPAEPQRYFEATTFNYFKHFYRIGLVADTHLSSKYQQLTCLHDAYRIFDDRDVDFILHAGDLNDGIGLYRGQTQEIFNHNAEDQRRYTEDNYPIPKKKGLKTYVIGGQHDFVFYKDKGYNIVEHICEHRKDLVYRGFYTAEFEVKGLPIRLEHPGSGVAYARSYAPQNIIENMMGYINTIPSAIKPALLVMGHWHTPLHLPVYMGIDAVTLPCFQAQTPFMQQHKNMMPTVGCAIADIYLNADNHLSSVQVEFIVMNDRVKGKDW